MSPFDLEKGRDAYPEDDVMGPDDWPLPKKDKLPSAPNADDFEKPKILPQNSVKPLGEAKLGVEKGDNKVEDDPLIQQVERGIAERLSKYTGDIAKMAAIEGEEASKQRGKRISDAITGQAWDRFVKDNPEKALAHQDKPGIKAALERKEKRDSERIGGRKEIAEAVVVKGKKEEEENPIQAQVEVVIPEVVIPKVAELKVEVPKNEPSAPEIIKEEVDLNKEEEPKAGDISPEELSEKLASLKKIEKDPLIKAELRVGEARSEADIKEFKRVRKESAAYVDRQRKLSRREDRLRKRKEKGGLLSAKEIAFLLSREKSEVEIDSKEEEIKGGSKQDNANVVEDAEKTKDVPVTNVGIENVPLSVKDVSEIEDNPEKGDATEASEPQMEREPIQEGHIDEPLLKDQERVSSLKTGAVEAFGAMITCFEKDGNNINITDKEALDRRYGQLRGLHKEMTGGEDLNKRIREEAKIGAEKQGKKIVSQIEYFSPEHTAKVEKRVHEGKLTENIRVSWQGLSEKERASFNNEPRTYTKHLEAKRKELAEKGFNFSLDVFYAFAGGGYDDKIYKIQDAKVKGWFRKRVVIPGADGKSLTLKKGEFDAWAKNEQDRFTQETKGLAEAALVKSYAKAKSDYLRRKLFTAKNILSDTVSGPKEEVSTFDDVAAEGESREVGGNPEKFDEIVAEEEIESKWKGKMVGLWDLAESVKTVYELGTDDTEMLREFVKHGNSDLPGRIESKELREALIETREKIIREHEAELRNFRLGKLNRAAQKRKIALGAINEKLLNEIGA
ncbi:MAG: hypothetical protein WC845_03950 [Candidatus Staskawiczbacteria bacterium]|jgi:hypothetical protein